MPTPDTPSPERPARLRGASEDFAAYCELELDRRADSDGSFDEPAFRRAVALVLERLRDLEAEGRR